MPNLGNPQCDSDYSVETSHVPESGEVALEYLPTMMQGLSSASLSRTNEQHRPTDAATGGRHASMPDSPSPARNGLAAFRTGQVSSVNTSYVGARPSWTRYSANVLTAEE